MKFLAIETSCDETAIAFFEDNKILKNLVYSQASIHREYGGVVPEIASRHHSIKIARLIRDIAPDKIDFVGFTRGPGLKGSLIIGKIAGEVLSGYFNARLIGVNHLEGHLLSVELGERTIEKRLRFPLISLIVSGGHSELWYVEDYGKYKMIGKTRDDACGEAFDKVAKLLKLPYPGGPVIEKLAKRCRKTDLEFTVPDVKNSFDYSFSGIKTQVSYYVLKLKKITLKDKIEIAYAFEDAIVKSLIRKLKLAVEKYKVRNIVVCGGVSANEHLRDSLLSSFHENKFNIYLPQKNYSSDNAAMIGGVMLRMIEKGKYNTSTVIDSELEISGWN